MELSPSIYSLNIRLVASTKESVFFASVGLFFDCLLAGLCKNARGNFHGTSSRASKWIPETKQFDLYTLNNSPLYLQN